MLYPIILLSTAAALALVFKKSLREGLLWCIDSWCEYTRGCDNWETGTYSSTSNVSEASGATIGIRVGEVGNVPCPIHSHVEEPIEEVPVSPPTSIPSTPETPALYSELSVVEEERSSQLSNFNNGSQNTIGLAAESIAEICNSTLSLNKYSSKPKLDKRKSTGSESSLKSKRHSDTSRGSTPSPGKLKPKKTTFSSNEDIDEEASFTSVEKKGRKSKSPEKPNPPISSASPKRDSPKHVQFKKPPHRTSFSDIQVKYTDKPSRIVDGSISYARVTSSSIESRIEIAVDTEETLLALKEPEPERPRPTYFQIRQDSSDSTTGSPVIFQTETIVHRAAESTDSDYSEDILKKNREQLTGTEKEDGNNQIDQDTEVAGPSKQSDFLSPIDSSGKERSDETTGADDENSDFLRKSRIVIAAQPVVHVPTPQTETETFDTGEDNKKSETGTIYIESIDSTTHDTLSVNTDRICNEFYTTRFRYFPVIPNAEAQSTIGEICSDILDTDSRDYGSEGDPAQELKSEDFSSHSDNNPSDSISGQQSASFDASESEDRSDFIEVEGVRIEIEPCSSRSISLADEDPRLLGYRLQDTSEDSLETAARLRRISESTEEQKSEKKESPDQDLEEKTSEDLSEDSSDKAKQKKKKGKGKKPKKSSEPIKEDRTEEDISEGDSLAISISVEEIPNLPLAGEEIEERFIEGEEIENQATRQSQQTEVILNNTKEKKEAITELNYRPIMRNQESSMENSVEDRQIRILTLNHQEHLDKVLFRLKKYWIIEFRLGPSLFGKDINVYCNFPDEEKGKLKQFDRNSYQLLKWLQDGTSESSDDTAYYAQIKCKISGSFHYYIVDKTSENKSVCGSGYFLVDPNLTFGENEYLPLDSIQCHTVISKNLGSFSTWESKLLVSKETGYNMVHFTPIQELGASNSAYCLSDQLKINPSFKKANGNMLSWEELGTFISKMRKEWKMLSICDIVLNHTANETPWIKEHVDATYNCLNCKYMRPAYLLDAALFVFQEDVKKGMYETMGIPALVETEDHLNAIRYQLKENVLKGLKLHELFICDVNDCVSKFMEMARQKPPGQSADDRIELKLIQDPDYKRLASSVDMDLALRIYNIYRPGCFDEDTRLRKSCEEFKWKIDSLNQILIDEVNNHLNSAVENLISGIRYWRVQYDGPKLGEITVRNPLIPRYFTDYGDPKSKNDYEELLYSDKGRFLMAHNGWVLDADPLVNLASPESNVYIRRELIPWGDSVKLRYGDKPSDSPFLWDLMRKYVELTASIFDGIRLDNCHSTPIHVAEYMMDCARNIQPDLYVVAELFANRDDIENIFINRFGITSLIREAMNAYDAHELRRLVHRYGGIPVGSFYQPNIRPLVPTVAHALFFDQTHDNPSASEKWSVFNSLPAAALVNMACCGTGSNRGYDELVPHQIDVVTETRQYTEWISENVDIPKYNSIECGIMRARRAINELHFTLGLNKFDEVYVDKLNEEIVVVTRHCPKTHRRYILVAFTAFSHPTNDNQPFIEPLRFEGVLDEIVLEATLSHTELRQTNEGSKYAHPSNFERNDEYINGLSEYVLHMREHLRLEESEVFTKTNAGNLNEVVLSFKNFKPGSVVILKVSLPQSASKAVSEVRKLTGQFSYTQDTELKRIIKKLKLEDMNRILYRCDQEERDEGRGFDTYDIPNYGKLVYAGLQGFMSLLSKIRSANDLGHPMCVNIRDGDWMIDYIYKRLKLEEGTVEFGTWIEKNTGCLKVLPRYLKPAYFDLVFTGIYVLLLEQSYESMSSFVSEGSTFVKALSMGSIQFAAYVKSADLPTLSPNLAPPRPPIRKDEKGNEAQICVSLSAGLPHFSVGYMRNWGRDTFIALRGLFLLTGRYQEARYHILAYAACLRHGLIPNLLDGGRKSRYNCRDAVWWWLYCIKCYAEEAPDGVKILEDKVSRIFPTDDSSPQQPGAMDQSLQDVIQEALNRHFQGVAFRERNAGREIDEQMTDNGFNNRIGVHPETGFVFGGNVDNCGTWMDKMGSSARAGNKGKPATPRDGSACEIVGLSKCAVSWLAEMNERGLYKYDGVERTHSNGKKTNWTFKFWSKKIQENFERYFWVNEVPTEGELKQNLINKRGIYKDCHGATQDWTDFQLRCNFPIVMTVAPELFNAQHAWTALDKFERHLLGPLGVKTLDPDDWAYRGDYDNSNDSADTTLAQGFNYHQGPEWVWPIGFFLRAKLLFAAKNNKLKETIAETKCILSKHLIELQTSDWKGLPELTNSNGSYCKDSSRTQAWSMSCVLEVLYDLQKIESSM